MDKFYSDEVNVQIVIALLKKHGINQVIVSPGTTNQTFIFSIQNDSFFNIYSCVDERSAAYMACGMAAESKKPVVLSCTGATASRNYLPGITEAYYRKLPILAITATRTTCQVGHLIDQQIDRSVQPNDTYKYSVNLPFIKDDEDFWECEVNVNKAILELTRHGGGPVHINLPTRYNTGYNCKTLPKVRTIKRYSKGDVLPVLPKSDKIGIYIGTHTEFSDELTRSIEKFCEIYNGVVFCEHTSNYSGKYAINFYPILSLKKASFIEFLPDVVIDIGEIAGLSRMNAKILWRVSPDGEIRDPKKNIEYIFEMNEKYFFDYYLNNTTNKINISFYEKWKNIFDQIQNTFIELPFSNIYAAYLMIKKMPENSVIHFGILNSLRSWNFFSLNKNIRCYANTGGYGIDGGLSTLIGASLVNPKKLYFGIFGDLSFFYDLNSLGNRHINNNVRILLINNGIGSEFKLIYNTGYKWGKETDLFAAAKGHFGNKSNSLVKHYAEDLGFEYFSASNKEDFNKVYERFIVPELTDKPIIFEIFTNDEDENNALVSMITRYENMQGNIKNIVKNLAGEVVVNKIKGLINNS